MEHSESAMGINVPWFVEYVSSFIEGAEESPHEATSRDVPLARVRRQYPLMSKLYL
ncbi:hypothetical protein [Xylanibacter muris]|uniref:hypothetical protein n=1 Tax=Xylanibacter muris TaxID=2736290 RepID=UPI002557F166|nr:hypothetical protein [Xylanibacter muris]